MIERWIEKSKERARRRYQDQLIGIDAQAQRMREGADLVLEKFPVIGKLIESGKYSVEFSHSSGESGSKSELSAMITLGEGSNRKIFKIEFVDRDYPGLGVKKGFTITSCKKPEEYKDFFDLYSKPEIWEEVKPGTPQFAETVGIGIYGLMGYLTEDADSQDLKRFLRFFEEQVG